ncbi:adenine specific DNA methylase Mod [Mycobacteroides abscessus subsp. bolletii]|nr:adenine specific DNA methylase Mod [Mycobacteroides abscessus subsp. bolletii]
MTPTPKNSTNFTAIDRLTADGTAQNIEGLALLFPEVITETLDENGRPTKAVNFEALQQLLSDHLVDPGKERYELTWPGKQQARFTAHQPIAKTLRPNRSESVDFDTTQNLFIEGDNLDALKILRNSYLGKVKLIYIDPPYNTGNDFVYKDDFGSTRTDYLITAEESDEEGNRLVSNTTSNGRFHSDWLSMMYSRLVLSRQLLRSDGVIAVSIDDDELPRLRQLLDEVFGEKNFYACVTWQKKYSPANDAKRFSDVHDYVVFYAASDDFKRNLFPRTAENNKPYKYDDNDGRGVYRTDNLSVRTYSEANDFPIQNPTTGVVYRPPSGRCWMSSQDKIQSLIDESRIFWGTNGDGAPQLKRYLSEVQQGTVPITLWDYNFAGHTDQARKEIRALFGTTAVFDTPKPTKLLQRILQVATSADQNDIVLDFFAGSATTANAVLKQNAEDQGNRRFIMVQLDEEHRVPEYKTIAKVSRERVRLAAILIRENTGLTADSLDLGFRALTVDDTNFANNFAAADALTQDDLLGQLSSVKTGRTGEDLLFQTLLSLGLPLDVDLKTLKIAGAEVYSVAGGSLLACFEPDLNDALVKALAEYARDYAKDELIPVDYLVLLDSAFETDASRINAGQIFNQLSPETSLRVI